MPLTHNHLFPPSPNDAAFHVWHSNGLIFFSDLFKDGTFVSFEIVQKRTIICQKHTYLDISRHAALRTLLLSCPAGKEHVGHIHHIRLEPRYQRQCFYNI